ncbi:putative sugar nucleotidyl transferase [Olivibacter sitiensis]|uniref:putative sugar nucleotidyl transferase n=1 Tax=Olivibacter sitiensis TaxID=376470 RepID=UPI000420FACC|nr:putative sugar nucleotidyl transferase [Olivibacter sitiensis]
MHIYLYDNASWRNHLYPLALTRPVSDLRIGALTIREKWVKWMGEQVFVVTSEYLQGKYPFHQNGGESICIRGNVLPDAALCDTVRELGPGQSLYYHDLLIAVHTEEGVNAHQVVEDLAKGTEAKHYKKPLSIIHFPEFIFLQNGAEIAKDFELLTRGRTSASLSSSNTVIGDRIFVEEGAVAECATFNTKTGPIYLGRNSEVWEGAYIRGPFALGEGSQVKMGAKIYSNVTVGPGSRVGGELNTSVIWGNSSKGHEGYMGNAVIGEWCNWGAGTSNSNLKNNYRQVRLYDYHDEGYRNTGLQFCGMLMGDHAKCAINTAFNTGTVVGVGASIFNQSTPLKFVPDFTWGGEENSATYELEKMIDTAKLVFARRNRTFDTSEENILRYVFGLTVKYRG